MTTTDAPFCRAARARTSGVAAADDDHVRDAVGTRRGHVS
jgi:hypothetical protein